MFEITTRPPNTYVFNNGTTNYQQQPQYTTNQLHRRSQASPNKYRSSSVTSSANSAYRNLNPSVNQIYFFNTTNGAANSNSNSNQTNPNVTTLPVSTPPSPALSYNYYNRNNLNGTTSMNTGKFIARVVNNPSTNATRNLISSSATHFQPNEQTSSSTTSDLGYAKPLTKANVNTNNGTTVLPVYYQTADSITTTLPVIKQTSNPSSANSSQSSQSQSMGYLKQNNSLLPSLVSNSANSGVGSATATVTVNNNSIAGNLINFFFSFIYFI